MFVRTAWSQVKMTWRRNICFECSLTLKVIKLATFFFFSFRNLPRSEFRKAGIEEMRGSRAALLLVLFISADKQHLQADSCAVRLSIAALRCQCVTGIRCAAPHTRGGTDSLTSSQASPGFHQNFFLKKHKGSANGQELAVLRRVGPSKCPCVGWEKLHPTDTERERNKHTWT